MLDNTKNNMDKWICFKSLTKEDIYTRFSEFYYNRLKEIEELFDQIKKLHSGNLDKE